MWTLLLKTVSRTGYTEELRNSRTRHCTKSQSLIISLLSDLWLSADVGIFFCNKPFNFKICQSFGPCFTHTILSFANRGRQHTRKIHSVKRQPSKLPCMASVINIIQYQQSFNINSIHYVAKSIRTTHLITDLLCSAVNNAKCQLEWRTVWL